MTPDYDFDETVTTAADFEATLGALLRAAGRNSVDPRGSWVYRDGATADAHWEALIHELEVGSHPD